jgi:hypothetical protein
VTQHPPVHRPKHPVLGFHGRDETFPHGSVYLVSLIYFSFGPFFFLLLTFCLNLLFFLLLGLLIYLFFPPPLLT